MDFDQVCKAIGRLYLESQIAMDALSKENAALKEQLADLDTPKKERKAS